MCPSDPNDVPIGFYVSFQAFECDQDWAIEIYKENAQTAICSGQLKAHIPSAAADQPPQVSVQFPGKKDEEIYPLKAIKVRGLCEIGFKMFL